MSGQAYRRTGGVKDMRLAPHMFANQDQVPGTWDRSHRFREAWVGLVRRCGPR